MNLHVVVAEKSFETEEEAVKLYKELLRLGMVVRLVEEAVPAGEESLRDLMERAGLCGHGGA